MSGKNQFRDKVIIKKRMLLIFVCLLIVFICLIGRLGYIMIVKSDYYKKLAVRQWTSKVKLEPKRGRILDRNGYELAVSANVYRVDLDMKTLNESISKSKKDISKTEIQEKKSEVAGRLSSILGMDKNEVVKILNKTLPNGKPMGSAILKRRIEKDEADKIRELKIPGVIISPDTKRYYPNNNFLAQVIGHTNSDGKGLTGIELEYDKYLAGKPGIKIAETDRKSEDLPYTISEYTKPQDGDDVVLTIDEMIQHFCEKSAQQALVDNKAKAVTIIVSDPSTGEILGMANKPDYNPNDPWEKGKSYNELQKLWRNRAVNDTFEPGSIFKVITSAAALQEGLVKENDSFNCNGGIKVANRIIHCWKRTGHGHENFVDILKNSCNVGFVNVGQKVGKEKLCKYINKFGFGQKTGIDLNGEAKGIVKKVNNITDVDLATIAFGQTNTVTCVQYLAAFNAVANGGKWIRPHIMKKIVNYNDNNEETLVKKYDDFGERRVIDANIASQLRGYLEKVISEGGGHKAFIDGYHIAGKTGTAQKVNPNGGGYESGKYIASFAGMAPANNPKISVLVSIDEPDPSNYYAGQIATPVGKQVFFDIFNYLSFKTDANSEDISKSLLKDIVVPEVRGVSKTEAVKILKSYKLECDIDGEGDNIVDISPKPGYTVKEGSKIILYTGKTSNYNKKVIVPNLKGYSVEDARSLLNKIGLKANFIGDGIVSEQSIAPDKEVEKGTTIVLQLEVIAD